MSQLSLEGELKAHFVEEFSNFDFALERDAGRPKLNLAKRTVTAPVNAMADTKQAAAIFGQAKPREENLKDHVEKPED